MLPNPFQRITPQHRNIRSITQGFKPFLNNLIFQYTNAHPFEPEVHSICTITLKRDYLVSYLYNKRYKNSRP